MPVETNTRVNYLDLLKVIGLTGIIIAHVGSPSWLMMLRSFDVPLMVILSAILADRSYKKYEGQGVKAIIKYYLSRFNRLVIPTWIFLTLYFVLNIILTGKAKTIKYYVLSYCLTRYGIGYVWIILIYLFSALLVPLFSKIKLSVKGAVIVVVTYVLYEVGYATIEIGGGVLRAS